MGKPTVDELQKVIEERDAEIQALQASVAEWEKLLDKSAPEAVYSSTFFLKRGTLKKQFTIRWRTGESSPAFLAREDAIIAKLGEMGWQGVDVDRPAPTTPQGRAVAPAARAAVPDDTTEDVFDAEVLVCSGVKNQTPRWAVRGGKWQKYGVAIYPEVLAEVGIAVKDLRVTEEYNLRGYTAYHTMKADGNPGKVTRLVRNGDA